MIDLKNKSKIENNSYIQSIHNLKKKKKKIYDKKVDRRNNNITFISSNKCFDKNSFSIIFVNLKQKS